MNNKEWLYSLDVADLSDWFDAEHENVERKCPGYEPENHRCRYHDTDFELTRENVCKLKREVAELKAENEKLKAEVIQYAKDCGECGMAMPKGVSWPRFSDSSLVQFGDSIEVAGGVFAVERVEFTEHRYRLFTDKVGCFKDSPIGWMVEKPKRHERDEGLA